MSYVLYIKSSASKEIARLHATDQVRARDAIEALQTTPRPEGVSKLLGSESAYRIRVGGVRILYAVHDVSRTIEVFQVIKRGDAYGKKGRKRR